VRYGCRRQGKARAERGDELDEGRRARGSGEWRALGPRRAELLAFACVGLLSSLGSIHPSIHLDFSSQFTRLRQIIRAEAELDAFALQRPAFADAAGGGFPGPERAARRQLAWRSRELATALGTRDRDKNCFPIKRRSIDREIRRNV
jgi:hypothetical protein